MLCISCYTKAVPKVKSTRIFGQPLYYLTFTDPKSFDCVIFNCLGTLIVLERRELLLMDQQHETKIDWAKNAENAAKKAEAEIDKIKKEAQDELNKKE